MNLVPQKERNVEQALTRMYDDPPSEQPTVDLSQRQKINYVRLLWSKKWWILLAAIVGSGAGAVWSVKQIPEYTATATIEIVGFNESFMGLNQFDPQAGTGSYSNTIANIQTQRGILMSSALRNRVVERLKLEVTPTLPPATDVFSKLRNRLGLMRQEPSAFTDEAIRQAASSLNAKGVGSSRLMEVSCDAPSAEIAAVFVNTIASEFVNQSAQLRTSSAAKTSQWLEGQIEETKLRVEGAEGKLQEFIKKEGLAFVLDQNTLADSKLRQLQTDLATLQSDRITKQSRYELAKSSPPESLPEILDDGTLRQLRTHLTDLLRERANLTTTLTSAHVKVQRLNAQISQLEETMREEKQNLLKRIQNEYEAALRRERLMAGEYTAQSRMLANQADKAGQYALLKREAEMARQSYNALLQQFTQASMVAAVPANTLRVVDTASPVSLPLRPKPMRDILSGTFFSAGLAISLILMIAKMRMKRLREVFAAPGHLGQALNLPELGVIPAGMLNVPKSSNRKRSRDVLALNPTEYERRGLVALKDGSILADSFRYALASVLARQAESEHVTLVVTSAKPFEGKTTLAGNLACAMAQTGRRVLLIDADLRRAGLHNIFKLNMSPGFADLILSDTDVSEVPLSDYLQPTFVDRLFLLPAGEASVEQIGPMMFSLRIMPLIARLRNEFDVVLIDTPPALQFPEARLLGQVSDGVVLVVRSGVTNRQNVAAAAERFAQDGIAVIGTILNDWTPDFYSEYGGDNTYSSHYHYAKEK